MRERAVILTLAAIALASAVLFMTIGLRGNIAFALELRATRLLALVNVAVAIAVSTVVFQTITGNRILTPAIMGLDALYQFAQVALVFGLGSLGYLALPPHGKFLAEAAGLMLLTCMLVLPAVRGRVDLGLMLLCGVVIGGLFRSLSQLLARLIDPQEFAVAQTALFADFSAPQTDLLAIASLATVAGCLGLWRQRHLLDVVALGRERAISLGVNWNRCVAGFLLTVAALVSVSTALVGPVTFFGLLVAALAERLIRVRRHTVLLLVACLVAIIVMVGGQTVLQHGLGQGSTLSVVIDFVGGVFFIILLFTGRAR